MTDKEFDKLFQEKLNNREFAFNPEAWKAVEGMLDAKKVAWYVSSPFKWGAGVLAAASIALAIYLTSPENPSTNGELPSISTTPSTGAPETFDETTPFEDGQSNFSAITEKKGAVSNNNQTPSKTSTRNSNNTTAAARTTKTSKNQSTNSTASFFSENSLVLNNKSLANLENTTVFTGQNNTKTLVRPEVPLTKKQATYMQNKVFLRVGGTIANGFKGNTAARVEQSQFLSFGLHYRRQVTQQWAWQAGLEWYERGAINTEFVQNRKHYGFGADRVTSHFITDNMQFLELPIQAIYKPQKNHQFLAGVYTAYLLSTKNTVIHHFQTETIGEIKHITNATNHMEGFNRLDFGLALGYEYEVFKSLAIGATANIGLRDLTINKTLGSNSKDFNHQVRVHVNYSFW